MATSMNTGPAKPKTDLATVHQTGQKTLTSKGPIDSFFKLVDPITFDERFPVRLSFVGNKEVYSKQQVELVLYPSQWFHIKKTKEDKLKGELLKEEIALVSDHDDTGPLLLLRCKVLINPTKDKKDSKVKWIQSVFQKLITDVRVYVSYINQDMIKGVKEEVCKSRACLKGNGTVYDIPEKSCLLFVTDKDHSQRAITELNEILKSCCQEDKQSSDLTGDQNALVLEAIRTLREEVQARLLSTEVELLSSVNEFLQKSEGARSYVIQKMNEKGIVCAFDHMKRVAVLEGQELPKNIGEMVRQLVIEIKLDLSGKNILKHFSTVELSKVLEERIHWEENTLFVIPGERNQSLTLIGIDESVTSAVELLQNQIKDFVEPFETVYQLEDKKALSLDKWMQLEVISRNLKAGIVKIVRLGGIQITGAKNAVDEFKQEIEKILCLKPEGETFPMTNQEHCLLTAKSKAGVYLKEQAEKHKLDVSVDIPKGQYVIKKKTEDSTPPKEFVKSWFDFVATTAKGLLESMDEESMRSYLKKRDVDDEKVLIQKEENSVVLIATADIFPDAEKVMHEMRREQSSTTDQAHEEKMKDEATVTTGQKTHTAGNEMDTYHPHGPNSTTVIFIEGRSKDTTRETRLVNLSFYKAKYMEQEKNMCDYIQKVLNERHNASIFDILSNESGITFTVERSNSSQDHNPDWIQAICSLFEKVGSTVCEKRIPVCHISPEKLTDDLHGKYKTALLVPLKEESCIVVVTTAKSMDPIMSELLQKWSRYFQKPTCDVNEPKAQGSSQGGPEDERTAILGLVFNQQTYEAFTGLFPAWIDVTAKMEIYKTFDVMANRKLVLLKGKCEYLDIFIGRIQSVMKETLQENKECKFIWNLKNVEPLTRSVMINEEHLCFLQKSQTVQKKLCDFLLQKDIVCALDESGKKLKVWHVVNADVSGVEEIVTKSINHRILSLNNYQKQKLSTIQEYFEKKDEDIIQVHQKKDGIWICFPSDHADYIGRMLHQFEEEFLLVRETVELEISQYEVVSDFHQSKIQDFAKENNVSVLFENPANLNGKYQIPVTGARKGVDKVLHFMLTRMKPFSMTYPLEEQMYDYLQTPQANQKLNNIQKENKCKMTFVEITDSPVGLQNHATIICRHFQKKKHFERDLMVIKGSAEDRFADVMVVPIWDTMKKNPSLQYKDVMKGSFTAKFEKGSKVCFQKEVLIYEKTVSIAYVLLPDKIETYEDGKMLTAALSQLFLELKKFFPRAKVLIEMNDMYEKLEERGLRGISKSVAEQFAAYDDSSLNLQLLFDYFPLARRAEVCLRSAFDDGWMNARCDMPKLILGTLASAKADVLVNTTSQDLNLQNGRVSQSLLQAAGADIQDECDAKRSGHLEFGDIVKTTAGKLKDSKAIFHGALSEITEKETFSDKRRILKNFMEQCLHQASKEGYSSIAFPALGTGKLEYPAGEVAEVMFQCVADFHDQCPWSPLHDIQFVMFHSDYECIQQFYAEETRRRYRFRKEGERIPEATFRLKDVLFQMVQGDVDKSENEEILYMVAEDKIKGFLKSLQLSQSEKLRVETELRYKKSCKIHQHPLHPGPAVVCTYRNERCSDVWKRVFQPYAKKVTRIVLYEQTEEADLERECLRFLKELKQHEVVLAIVFCSAAKYHLLGQKFKPKQSEEGVFLMKTTGLMKESVEKSVEEVLLLLKKKFAVRQQKGPEKKSSTTEAHRGAVGGDTSGDAWNFQMVSYEKEYCSFHLRSGKSSTSFTSELTLPEWLHIRAMPKLMKKLETDLPKVKINFNALKDISVQYDGHEILTLKDKFLEVLSAIRRTLLIQACRIQEEHHFTAMKKLLESNAYKTRKATFWKSHDGVFIFVVDKDTKDGLNEFLSIISWHRGDKGTRESNQPNVQAHHQLQQEVKEMGEELSAVLCNLQASLKPREIKALETKENIRNSVITKLKQRGIACSFDFQNGIVEFSSEEKDKLKIENCFHSQFDELSMSMTSVIRGFTLEEICDIICRSLDSTSDLVVITPEQDHLITIFGIAEAVKKAEKVLTNFIKDFQNADTFPIIVPGEKVSEALWQNLNHIAAQMQQGRIKLLSHGYDPPSILAFGRKQCVDEFQGMVMKQCSQNKSYPIMNPQLSLLAAKRDVVSYLTEEARKRHFQLEVDLENKRYSIHLNFDQQAEVDLFLRDWCKTEELKFVQGTEEKREAIDTYLKSDGSEIYNRLLLLLNGSTIHLITTANDFDKVIKRLKEWRDSVEEKIPSRKKKTDDPASQTTKFASPRSMSSSPPRHHDTDSSSAGAAAAATGDSDDDDDDGKITKCADGRITLSCKLSYTLAEYCSKTADFKDLVVDEFKTHGFQIQIDKDCKRAVIALSNDKEKAKVIHLLNSFGARKFEFADSNYGLSAVELKRRLSQNNPNISDKTIYVPTPPSGKDILMVFGVKWQLDVLCLQLKEMLHNFELQTFSISISKHLKEDEVEKKLKLQAKKMQCCWKFAFEDKELRVQIAKSHLEKFRTLVYDLLENLNDNSLLDDLLKVSFSVSQQMIDFLKREKINKELKDRFKFNNLTFYVENKCVRFGAISYSSLKQADSLFESCVLVERHNLQSKPIGVMMQGDDLTNIFEQREELLSFVDDAHVLNVICLAQVLEQVEQELKDKSDEYDEHSIQVSIEDLEMKMASEMLTSELFELDKMLMGQVKVLVDGESVRIVAKRDLLPRAEMKVRQIVQRIETEKEINCQNPYHVMKLDKLQVKLLERPGILANVNRKMEEQHFQVLYDFKKNVVKLYGLTEKFVQIGKSLFESIFKRIELPIFEDSVLKEHDLDALQEMVKDQLNNRMERVVVEADTQKGTLIFVCISDDYTIVQEVIEEMKFVGAQVVHCREEILIYMERYRSEDLNEICGKDVSLKTKLSGVQSELKITGPKSKLLMATDEIQKLCSKITVLESQDDERVSLDKSKMSLLSEIGTQLRCVINVNEQGAADKTIDNPTVSENDLLKVEKADLSALKTDAIAVMFAEKQLPNLVETSLKKGTPGPSHSQEILLDIGELETKKTDVLVNSVGINLIMSQGGVAKALNRKTQGLLEYECRKEHPRGIKYGKVIETKPFGLPCKKVLHGALTQFQEMDEGEQTDKSWKWKMMRTFISKCLKLASKDESIAFPALGTGNLKYPLQEAAATMVDEIQNFFNENPSTRLKNVEIVLHPSQEYVIEAFAEELMSHYQRLTGLQQSVIKSDRFAIQVLRGNGPCNFAGSNQILCFWDQETLKDHKKHPVLGTATELDNHWREIEKYLKEQKVHTGHFKSILKEKCVMSFLVDHKSFADELKKALVMAANSSCTVLHVPLTDERDNEFAKLLKVHLLEYLKGTQLIIRIVTTAAMFQELSNHFQQEVQQSRNADNPGAQGTLGDGELTRETPSIVIAAQSQDVCKRALERVKQICFEVAEFPSLEEAHLAYEDAFSYAHISMQTEMKSHPDQTQQQNLQLPHDLKHKVDRNPSARRFCKEMFSLWDMKVDGMDLKESQTNTPSYRSHGKRPTGDEFNSISPSTVEILLKTELPDLVKGVFIHGDDDAMKLYLVGDGDRVEQALERLKMMLKRKKLGKRYQGRLN